MSFCYSHIEGIGIFENNASEANACIYTAIMAKNISSSYNDRLNR